jgi:predicted enzyme related to lactoylglutathione lyase
MLNKEFKTRKPLPSLAFGLMFALSIAILNFTSQSACAEGEKPMAKVTGIGGVFFKAKGDPKALADWYEKNLGMKLEPWGGAILRWKEDTAEDGGGTAWHVHDSKTDHFEPSKSNFMINYRIDNMDSLIAQLKANNTKIEKGPESHENGKFLWVMDPDGNKVELWEPKIWDDKNKEK